MSNENPWGVMRFLEESKKNLPRMITIQNSYSLLNRQFEVGNAEVSVRENIGLLDLILKQLTRLIKKKSCMSLA